MYIEAGLGISSATEEPFVKEIFRVDILRLDACDTYAASEQINSTCQSDSSLDVYIIIQQRYINLPLLSPHSYKPFQSYQKNRRYFGNYHTSEKEEKWVLISSTINSLSRVSKLYFKTKLRVKSN